MLWPAHGSCLNDAEAAFTHRVRSRVAHAAAVASQAACVEMTTVAPVLPARYRIDRPLGRGAFGAVWLAHDEMLDRPVAIKVLAEVPTADGADALLQEAQRLAKVRSPFVVAVLDVLELDTGMAIVLEFVPGGSLSDHMAQHTAAVDRAAALTTLLDLTRGLAAVHAAGLLHCDLKPANVLLDADGRARLADFGLSRLFSRVDSAAAGGSLGYAAPEVVLGEPPTMAADVYALGVIAWELLLGRPAFAGARTLAVVEQQLTEALPSLASEAADVPGELRALLDRCRSSDPANRPSAAALVAALTVPLNHASDATRLRGLSGIGVLLVPVAVLCALLVLVVISGYFSLPRPRYAVYRAVRDVLFKPGALAVASLAAALESLYRASAGAKEGDVSRLALMREMLRAPAWWPTWYPGHVVPGDAAALFWLIRGFRFVTWWVLPVLGCMAAFVMVLALAPTPWVEPSLARSVLVCFLLSSAAWMGWLALILLEYRENPVLDVLEVAEVALWRPQSPLFLAYDRANTLVVRKEETVGWLTRGLARAFAERAAPVRSRRIVARSVITLFASITLGLTVFTGWSVAHAINDRKRERAVPLEASVSDARAYVANRVMVMLGDGKVDTIEYAHGQNKDATKGSALRALTGYELVAIIAAAFALLGFVIWLQAGEHALRGRVQQADGEAT